MKRRVVITGMGTVNPLANDTASTWDAVKAGKCGISLIESDSLNEHTVKLAGQVKNLDMEQYIEKKEIRRMDRYNQLAMCSAVQAFSDSGIDINNEDADRCGVIFSSGIGGLGTIEKEYQTGQRRTFDKISPFFIPMTITNMAAGSIAIRTGFKGMCTCVVTACASSTNAIGDAFHYIRDGYSEVMIAGGAESTITDLGVGGFTCMKALNTTDDQNRASIPFDKERAGFVMGEGAATLVLEELEHAKARNAKIYAEVVGYGATCDAYHITAPLPDGAGGAKCMSVAIKDADITPDMVDYVNAHGTSTHLNDACETQAIKTAFGDHAYKLMVSSTKSMTGHMLGGSGAMEALICALALKEGYVPATINYQVPDEECDLDIVPNEGRVADIKYAISNSLGFGGHNASILLKKWEA